MAELIRLIVWVPSFSLRRHITVRSNITIQDLKRYLPDADCGLIFGGSTLMRKMPLMFCSLSDGATLCALTPSSATARVWSCITSDMDALNKCMRIRTGPLLAGKSARLKDLRMVSLAQHRGLFYKFGRLTAEPEMPNVFVGEMVPARTTTRPSVEP
jgi:hypothetical protein